MPRRKSVGAGLAMSASPLRRAGGDGLVTGAVRVPGDLSSSSVRPSYDTLKLLTYSPPAATAFRGRGARLAGSEVPRPGVYTRMVRRAGLRVVQVRAQFTVA